MHNIFKNFSFQVQFLHSFCYQWNLLIFNCNRSATLFKIKLLCKLPESQRALNLFILFPSLRVALRIGMGAAPFITALIRRRLFCLSLTVLEKDPFIVRVQIFICRKCQFTIQCISFSVFRILPWHVRMIGMFVFFQFALEAEKKILK